MIINLHDSNISTQIFIYVLFGVGVRITAREDNFTHFETSQSVGGAKTGDPLEKPPDHPQAELCLSHM